MKRITISLMAICLVLLLAQCRKTNVKPLHNDMPDVELTEFSLTANSGERSTINGLVVNWSEGDKIYVVDMDATGSGLLGYLSAENGGTTSTTFSGSIIAPTAGHRCLFYYVGLNTFTVNSSGQYTYSVANQNGLLSGDSDLDIANRFQLLKSTASVTVTADMIKNHNFGSSPISFKGMMAIAHLNFKVDDESYSGTVIVTGGYATATLNAKTGALTPISGTVTLNNANGDYYMVVIPENQNDGGSNQTLWFTTSGGKHCQQDNLPIAANKFYNKATAKDIDMYVPASALCGEFSLSATEKGYFSKGNLQYIGSAASPYWKFADNQWVCFGNNGQMSNSHNVDRDLFGWGCTGVQDSRKNSYSTWYQTNFMPYSMSDTQNANGINDYGYGPDYYSATPFNLAVEYDSDWGSIVTLPDNSPTIKLWKTPSASEWTYLVNTRPASTVGSTENVRYAKVTVNGVAGIMLFPDVFTWPSTVSQKPSAFNSWAIAWNAVNYSVAEFVALESAGVVFLPMGGRRQYTSFDNSYGNYWSSTANDSSKAINLLFYDNSNGSSVNTMDISRRFRGFSVRLVYQTPSSASGTTTNFGDGGGW